ncbi:MAG: DNA polymerase III subunit gamma/tau [Bacilli bacterium]
MYQALYRKYRPETFDQVVGQNIIIQTLKNAINSNKLSHAYLFSGPRGTGKTSVAKILAKTINCESLFKSIPCNKCVNCTQYNNKQMIDIIEIDAASNNGVEEIRELKSKVSLVPNTGKYKIYIIDEVHMLTVGAFNALLKTLEEPPQHIVFVLATTEPQKIPATIVSRCQRFDFKKISDCFILKYLKEIAIKENINITEDALKEIARLSAGGMRDAIGMLDQISSFSEHQITLTEVHEVNGTLDQKEIKKIIESLIIGDITKLLKMVDKYNDDGKNLSKLIEEIILFLKNILLSKKAPVYFKQEYLNVDLYNVDINEEYLIKCIEIFNESLYKIKTSNNQKLILEITLIKLINNNSVKKTQNNKILINDKKEALKQSEICNKINDVNADNKKKFNLYNQTMKTDEGVKDKNKDQIIKIKEKIESIILENVNSELKEKLKQVKKIRINNALSTFNRKQVIEFKSKLNLIENLILDPIYNYEASMLLDSKLKAIGNEYMIFVYETEHISDLFNQHIITIEEMLEKVYNNKYKVIATYIDEWNIIKNQFNNKKTIFTLMEDNIDVKKILKNDKQINVNNDIEQLFDEIVEYN